MTKRKVLGVEVETDLPQGATESHPPPPGGFYGDEPAAGPGEAETEAVERIADALDGIRTELREIRKLLTDRSGGR